MCRLLPKRGVALSLALVIGACTGTPDMPSSPAGSDAGHLLEDGSVRAAGNPVGTFRTTPAADQDVITVLAGESVSVNGARFTAADPADELKVDVEWGDGERDTAGCGACRVSHVYRRRGTYEVIATIHNRRVVDRGSVTQSYRVVVQDLQVPEAAAPAPQFCHSIVAVSGVGAQPAVACPSGVTQFCDSVPIVPTSSAQARMACQACAGTATTCTNQVNMIDRGDNWFFQVPWIAAHFQYTDDPAPGTKTPGDISYGVLSKGRWAP